MIPSRAYAVSLHTQRLGDLTCQRATEKSRYATCRTLTLIDSVRWGFTLLGFARDVVNERTRKRWKNDNDCRSLAILACRALQYCCTRHYHMYHDENENYCNSSTCVMFSLPPAFFRHTSGAPVASRILRPPRDTVGEAPAVEKRETNQHTSTYSGISPSGANAKGVGNQPSSTPRGIGDGRQGTMDQEEEGQLLTPPAEGIQQSRQPPAAPVLNGIGEVEQHGREEKKASPARAVKEQDMIQPGECRGLLHPTFATRRHCSCRGYHNYRSFFRRMRTLHALE